MICQNITNGVSIFCAQFLQALTSYKRIFELSKVPKKQSLTLRARNISNTRSLSLTHTHPHPRTHFSLLCLTTRDVCIRIEIHWSINISWANKRKVHWFIDGQTFRLASREKDVCTSLPVSQSVTQVPGMRLMDKRLIFCQVTCH